MPAPADSITIVVPAGRVGANLTGFPVYLDLSWLGSTFWSTVDAAGAEIRITKEGVSGYLPRDLISINTGTQTGHLFFKADLQVATDNIFYVEYNTGLSAPAATDPDGQYAVWSAFECVYLLNSNLNDRKGDHNLTTKTGTPSYTTFDLSPFGGLTMTSADYQATVENTVATGTTFTIGASAIYTDLTTQNRQIASYLATYNSDTGRCTLGHHNVTGDPWTNWDNTNSWNDGTNITQNVAARVHGVWQGSTAKRLYLNGVLDATDVSVTAIGSSNDTFTIGGGGNTGSYMRGQIGYIYLIHSALSAEWTKAEYDNLADNETFFTEPAPVESRLTQVPTLFLYEEASPARVTQAPTLVLYEEAAPARVTQAPTLVLIEYIPESRVTHVPTLVLYEQIPCVQKWAQCWKITRRDGVVLGFTGCDQTVSFGGVDYIPCGSLMSSAMQYSALIAEAGNQELLGLIDSELITARDLAAGVYHGAIVEIYLLPWQGEAYEAPIRATRGYVASVEMGDVSYKAEVLTDSAKLQQKAVLDTYTPSCRWVFGDDRCGVDANLYEETSTVTAVLAKSAIIGSTRRQFVATLVGADGDYISGKITWLTGDNAGQVIEVKDNVDGLVTLWDTTLADIAIGDTFTIQQGCEKTEAACKGYSNFTRFGGFPDIPGRDKMLETPDAKQG